MASKTIALSKIYTQKILEEIKDGIYANSTRLPSETEIAEYFNISRTLVRDCLSKIEREGFISRKHGVGTIVNKHVLEIKTRIDLEQEFLEMVRTTNRNPSLIFVVHGKTIADEEISKNLKIKVGESILFSERLVAADGEPAIYCIDYISEKCVRDKNYDINILDEPIFIFLEKYCNTEVFMDLSEIKAIIADIKLSDIFHIEVGKPILFMNEVGYSLYGQPVLYSKEYYKEGMFNHTILRKKI